MYKKKTKKPTLRHYMYIYIGNATMDFYMTKIISPILCRATK